MADMLKKEGVSVRYRDPPGGGPHAGHMNVLLANQRAL